YGLLKYNPGAEKFHVVNSGTVIWMSPTKQGDVIAYSGKLMLYQHEQTLPASISFIPVPAFFEKIYRVIPNSTANMALQNKDGHYWINSAGIFEFNALNNQLKKVSDLHSAIFPFYADENNELWFGSSDAFCRLDKISGKIFKYPYPLNNVPQFPYNFLQTVLQDTDSSFWLGTVNGLFRFNEKNKSWKQYKNNPKDTASLSADVIFTVCNDPLYPEKYLWLGTNGGGLNRLDKQTGKFIHYNEKDGLPNKVVYGILSDNENNLWMSTNKGLSRFTPSYKANTGGIFKNFEEEDGLQSNEFNRNAFCKTPAGTLFFGGVNGFNYFNPKEIKDNPAIPNVVITDFKINNEPVLFRAGNNAVNNQNTPLSKPVFLSEKIVLPYADNMFSFDFASMDFTAPEKNLYQYKLSGFDKDWIQSANNHSATYTNLDPGTYIFTVKGSNNDGVWNEQGASITLTILPPWYLTWWFRITVVAIVMAFIYLLFRYRLQQKIKLLNVRNRIASDLHDEIGSTLSSVYIYSEVAQKAATDKLPETNTYLKQISADVANMIEALSDIVWTVNAKNDRFENIINRMRAAAIELFEASGYELQLQFDEQLNTLKLGMEDRKNFYLIYKEAINNVAKYAAGKNVSIHLSLDRSTILLSVKDDGKGFSINREDQGNGLTNMKKRTQELQGQLEIISGQGNGTEIKLAFPI
ncbi:MAG: triple tyrosine motif-containing protein, partial [Panacibacter sp.]